MAQQGPGQQHHGVQPAIFSPGEYGRIIGPDGREKWWVRAPNGHWVLLTRHQVARHEDGTITVSPLR
jgi:hypothetical protein